MTVKKVKAVERMSKRVLDGRYTVTVEIPGESVVVPEHDVLPLAMAIGAALREMADMVEASMPYSPDKGWPPS